MALLAGAFCFSFLARGDMEDRQGRISYENDEERMELNMMKKLGAMMAALLVALACLLTGPAALHAASAELSATAKAAFDKMVAAAGGHRRTS